MCQIGSGKKRGREKKKSACTRAFKNVRILFCKGVAAVEVVVVATTAMATINAMEGAAAGVVVSIVVAAAVVIVSFFSSVVIFCVRRPEGPANTLMLNGLTGNRTWDK